MGQEFSWTISPEDYSDDELGVGKGRFGFNGPAYPGGGWPTLLLDASALAESGNGSKETPYVVAY